MNDVIYGNCAEIWLKQHGLLLEDWNIPDKEINRIRNSNINITIIFSPGSRLEICNNLPRFLIILDAAQIEENVLNKEEFIACILHEIGHVLNIRTGISGYVDALEKINEEYQADNYACKCGYQKHMKSALMKLQKRFPKTFKEREIHKRILEIEKYR